MVLNDIVFVPSIQHTGTWFTIRFLQNFYPTAVEADKVWKNQSLPDGRCVLHSHFPIVRQPEIQIDMDWWSRRQMVLKDKFLDLRTIELLASMFKTVIPVRDPLAAILTRETREPHLRHFYIVDGFVDLAQRFWGHPNIFFLPVDLPWSKQKRTEELIKLLEHLEIPVKENMEMLQQFSAEWKPQNVTPGNKLKQLYQNGDIEQIRYLLGPKVAELKYLSNMAAIIHPFLVDLGYTKGDIALW
jgi:molybdopterin-guanine dinucleotide biosynthesis protein A